MQPLIILLLFLTANSYANADENIIPLHFKCHSAQANLLLEKLVRNSPYFKDAISAKAWYLAMSGRLQDIVPDEEQRLKLLYYVHYDAMHEKIDPHLILAMIEVESTFNPTAISHKDALGLMQIMPFWIRVIGNRNDNLLDMATNIRYGVIILRHYLDLEKGNTIRALERYNGSLGIPDYPQKVLITKYQHWLY